MSKDMGYTSKNLGLGFRVAETPTSQEQVFELLLDGAGAAYTEAQVREQLSLPKSTTHRALQELVARGLVGSSAVGRTLLYSVDSEDELVRHLKIVRAIARARGALEPVKDLVDTAILFGSASRGEDVAESDVDLLVVTRDVDNVLSALAGCGWLQPLVVTPSEHMALIAEGGALAQALASGIVVTRSQ